MTKILIENPHTIISALAVLIGSLLGSYFSWIIAKKTNNQSIKEQYRILEENRKYDLYHKGKSLSLNANIVRLDVSNVIFQSIRVYKEYKKYKKITLHPVAYSKNYSLCVASLGEAYTVKELSYIYQLYGIIDRLGYLTINYSEEKNQELICTYIMLLNKLYGDNIDKICNIDDKNICYKKLYESKFMKKGYKNVLIKLEKLCETKEYKIDNLNEYM